MDPSVLRTLRHLYFAKYTPSADGAYWMTDRGDFDMEMTDESLPEDVPESIEPPLDESLLPKEVLGEKMPNTAGMMDDLPVGDAVSMPDEDLQETEGAKEDESEKININTASKEELMTIDTIGGKAAELIMAYREENPFVNCEAITRIKGIGQKRFEKIADQIMV
jgi:competence ComEA-like helix-hairpin-helix protein